MNSEDNKPTPPPEPTVEGPEKGVPDGAALAEDASRAPEEESQSQIPGDPRSPHEMQPPTSVGY